MKPDPLTAAYERWRKANPPRTSISRWPDGYRPCAHLGCIVLIEEGQVRELCYGHGGKPNPYRKQARPGEVWRQHVADMRRKRAKRAKRGRPAQSVE